MKKKQVLGLKSLGGLLEWMIFSFELADVGSKQEALSLLVSVIKRRGNTRHKIVNVTTANGWH